MCIINKHYFQRQSRHISEQVGSQTTILLRVVRSTRKKVVNDYSITMQSENTKKVTITWHEISV